MDSSMRSRNGHVQQTYPYTTDSSLVQFSNPWDASRLAATNPTSAPYNGMTSTTMAPTSDLSAFTSKSARQNSVSSSFEQLALAAPMNSGSMSSPFNLLTADPYSTNGGYPSSYADHTTPTTATSGSPYNMSAYGSAYDQPTKNLHSSLSLDYSRPNGPSSLYATSDTLDASRGMMALSQNGRFSIPGSHRTSSTASSISYGGYPQSTSSSISSASSYPQYYGSMDSTGTDLSSIGDIYDQRPSLPRPAGMIQSQCMSHPSNPQAAMMGTFSSRVQTNTSKKHKCKVCDKRFTRPSSLQTHMYSHTGEKPFACEVDGCGKQFSVVSNLRRHRKVHKDLVDHLDHLDTMSNAGSIGSV